MHSPRKWRVGIVGAGATLIIGTLTLAATSTEPSKPGPVVIEAQEAPTVADRPGGGAPSDAPARARPPSGAACSPGWGYFDNPVAHYGMCVPPGWGFSDFRAAEPLDTIPRAELESLHLLSSGAFPWTRGRMPFDAVASGAVDIELDVVPRDARSTSECEPSAPVQTPAGTLLTCEQPYDASGLPATNGPLRALKVALPLRQPPSDDPAGNLESARLLIIVRYRSGSTAKEVDALWQIIRSVRAY